MPEITLRAAQVARDIANELYTSGDLAYMHDRDILRSLLRGRKARRHFSVYQQRCRDHWKRSGTFRRTVMRRLLPMATATARRHHRIHPNADFAALETVAMEELLAEFWEVWEAATNLNQFWRDERKS